MKIKVNENVITIVTDVAIEDAFNGYTDHSAYDDKGNQVYKMAVNLDGLGSLGIFGITCNTIIDGKAALVLVEPLGTSKDDIKHTYGKAVLVARKYLPIIAAAEAEAKDAINNAFAEDAENTEE